MLNIKNRHNHLNLILLKIKMIMFFLLKIEKV